MRPRLCARCEGNGTIPGPKGPEICPDCGGDGMADGRMLMFSEQASRFATTRAQYERARTAALTNRVGPILTGLAKRTIAPSEAVADLVAACAEHDGRVRS